MPLILPESATELDNRARTDVQRELAGSNPFSKNHWLAALITAYSNRLFDFYLQLVEAIEQNLPDTATGRYLARWLAIYRIAQLEATSANGIVIATGVLGNDIPLNTVVTNNDGLTYTSTDSATILEVTINVAALAPNGDAGISRSGNVVTVTFFNPHGLASGLTVEIQNSTEDGFNDFWDITVINPTQYTFIKTSGNDDNSGNATSTAIYASVSITSDDTGASANLDSGGEVTLESPLPGVDEVMTVDAGGIGGGTDIELEADTRTRMVDRIQNPVAHYNPADIETLARSINGVTRVFVQTPSSNTSQVIVNLERISVDGSATNIAALATIQSGTFPFFSGQSIEVTNSGAIQYNTEDAVVTIVDSTTLMYKLDAETNVDAAGNQANITGSDVPLGTTRVFFMRDNDVDANGDSAPFPTLPEIAVVKALLDTILPANTSSSDLVVNSPTPLVVDFDFVSIVPNTESMQNAVIESLQEMMVFRTSVGLGITEDIYRAAITNTFDEVDARFIESFVLSNPTNGIAGVSGALPTLGDVTFA